MRLLKVRFSGFARFETETSLLVSERLVAVVGPNESGKTTILRGLASLNDVGELQEAFRTRQVDVDPQIEALFELDEGDYAALQDVPDARRIERAWYVRSSSTSFWRLEEEPRRELAHRHRALSRLAVLQRESIEDSDGAITTWFNEWRLNELISSDDPFGKEDIKALRDASRELSEIAPAQASEQGQAVIASAVEELRALLQEETRPSPATLARSVLAQRKPRFMLFDQAQRDLNSEYDLDEALSDESPPPALANLADLADLNLHALLGAVSANDHGTVALLISRANARLQSAFTVGWSQSDISVTLDTDGYDLRVLVRSEGGEDISPLNYRSDGLRWFIALRAFLAQRGVQSPILLIDEIETHLHYSAQADLVDILNAQRLAQQVIYTTHSAGALPPDLGTGIRAVVPDPHRQRSRIDNAFWTAGPGYTPLLFGLGATTLAFAIPRRLLLCEGASEAILLPTLLRLATGEADLPYRLAPGIANTPQEDLPRLDEEAGRVAYLVDGDDAGEALRRRLIEAKVAKAQICSLKDVSGGRAITLEDLVSADAYLGAVNAELRPYVPSSWKVTSDDISDCGRASEVKSWCSTRNIAPPSKVRVAQRLVELSDLRDATATGNRPALLTSEGKGVLRKVDRFARRALRVDGPSGARSRPRTGSGRTREEAGRAGR